MISYGDVDCEKVTAEKGLRGCGVTTSLNEAMSEDDAVGVSCWERDPKSPKNSSGGMPACLRMVRRVPSGMSPG